MYRYFNFKFEYKAFFWLSKLHGVIFIIMSIFPCIFNAKPSCWFSHIVNGTPVVFFSPVLFIAFNNAGNCALSDVL